MAPSWPTPLRVRSQRAQTRPKPLTFRRRHRGICRTHTKCGRKQPKYCRTSPTEQARARLSVFLEVRNDKNKKRPASGTRSEVASETNLRAMGPLISGASCKEEASMQMRATMHARAGGRALGTSAPGRPSTTAPPSGRAFPARAAPRARGPAPHSPPRPPPSLLCAARAANDAAHAIATSGSSGRLTRRSTLRRNRPRGRRIRRGRRRCARGQRGRPGGVGGAA